MASSMGSFNINYLLTGSVAKYWLQTARFLFKVNKKKTSSKVVRP